MSNNLKRVLRALAREGLRVSPEGDTYSVRLADDPNMPTAEVLLPAEFPLEGKALRQLAQLAAVHHPDGGSVCRACATPDFHPGDSGIAIGSIVETKNIIIPAAVGKDINCGMRFHVADMNVDAFMDRKQEFVDLLKGDYLLGTRDVEMSAKAMRAMFREGLPAWVEAVREDPRGFLRDADLDQIAIETLDRVMYQGSMLGDVGWAPEKLVPSDGAVRDDGLGTIGRGNHFVEIQVVEEVLHGGWAYQWGVREGQVAFMIHSGSRSVGLYVGALWQEKARQAWPAGERYPKSGIFPISINDPMFEEYIIAEGTAANYGSVNRALLAELLRRRLRQVWGDVEAPLVYDLPHNVTAFENGRWVARKGACPAHAGQPVIIPGSMGSPSYLLAGRGNERFLSSASHGAGRATSRGSMGRVIKDEKHAEALGLTGIECITLREERRVEEAPAAYKPIQPVIDSQVRAGMVEPVARMRPLLTFKA